MIFEAFEIEKLYIVISNFGKLRGVVKNVARNVKYFYVKYYENKINITKKKLQLFIDRKSYMAFHLAP